MKAQYLIAGISLVVVVALIMFVSAVFLNRREARNQVSTETQDQAVDKNLEDIDKNITTINKSIDSDFADLDTQADFGI
jgi:peptidoglycan hydrolase CwlO-like protein